MGVLIVIKEKVIKIQNVSDFLKEIKKINNNDSKFFYRGQPENYETMLPSLLRKSIYKDNEKKLIEGFLTRDPDLFANSENNFDSLALMQHHQLPTRLLDLTTNPLVALYFSCEGLEEKDGVIFAFSDKINKLFLNNGMETDIKNEDILKSPYSDQVEILSSMSRLKKEDRKSVLKKIGTFYEKIDKKEFTFKDWERFYKKEIISASEKSRKNNCINEKNKKMMDLYNDFDDDVGVKRLYHEIRRDIKSFEPIIDPFTLTLPKIIMPRIIDDRIKNQKGLLLFVPFLEGYEKKPSMPGVNETIASLRVSVKDESGDEEKVLYKIPFAKKDEILKELAQIGITQSFIYPGHRTIAEEVSDGL